MPSKTVVKEYYCKKNTKVDITERVLKGPEERLNFRVVNYCCTRVPVLSNVCRCVLDVFGNQFFF
jgi:hypothetical protein